MLNCIEATLELERMKFENATIWKKISVKAHLMMCKSCTNYKKDSQVIDRILQGESLTQEDLRFTKKEIEELMLKLKS